MLIVISRSTPKKIVTFKKEVTMELKWYMKEYLTQKSNNG